MKYKYTFMTTASTLKTQTSVQKSNFSKQIYLTSFYL